MRLPALLAAAALAAGGAAWGQTSGHLTVSRAWSRPAVQGANAAGFMTITNRGGVAIALVGADSPLARKVDIHRSSLNGGVMSMSVQSRLEAPAAGMAQLAPGGSHLMFYGISKTLKPGDRLPATLRFSDGRRLAVEFVVGLTPPPANQTPQPKVTKK